MTCNGKHEVRACFFKYPIIQTTAVQRRMRQLADMGYSKEGINEALNSLLDEVKS